MTTEIDRLNALLVERADEIASLKKTIEWYQAQAAQRIGAAARSEIAGAPAQGAGEVQLPKPFFYYRADKDGNVEWGEDCCCQDDVYSNEETAIEYETCAGKVYSEAQVRILLESRASSPAAPLPELTGPSALLTDLQAIDRAMQHMGDVLNNMDAVEGGDEQLCAPGFAAIAKLLSAAALPSPAPAQTEQQELTLKDLAAQFSDSAESGAPLTISADSAALLFSAMTTPPSVSVEPGRDLTLRVAGKRFRCKCGCNVFQHPTGKPSIFKCNSCAIEYEGNDD